jgi:hypothetical protein
LSFSNASMMVCFSSPDVEVNHSCCSSINHNGYFVFFFGVRLPKFSVIVSVKAICWDHSSNLKHQSRKPSWKLADYPNIFCLAPFYNCVLIPRTITIFRSNRKRILVCGCGFLYLKKLTISSTHGIFRHGLSVVDETSYVGIRSVVNINRESGKWC